MNLIEDQNYLKANQYKTAEKLQARVKIHRLFSTNAYGWFRWEFEHLVIQPGERVLDLGCGPAELWKTQAARIPERVSLVLCDLSTGMLQTARESCPDDPRFDFTTADAQNIPFQKGSFDLVTANHMLYHVPDIAQALREIRRVLRPGGRLVAATNGIAHMRQLYELVHRVLPGYSKSDSSASRFGLENGPAQVREAFASARVEIYEDGLFVTDAQLLLDYIGSMWGIWGIGGWDETMQSQLRQRISQEIERAGGFKIDKSSGVILAEGAR